MPDGKTHRTISAVGGLGLGLYMAGDCPTDAALARAGGCLVGTLSGGALRDLIEPSISPWHRRTAHSLTAGGGLTWLTLDPPGELRGAVDDWNKAARKLRELRLALPENHPDRTGLWLKEMGLHALIGLLAGLLLGYFLHLAADATTPRGLPLL